MHGAPELTPRRLLSGAGDAAGDGADVLCQREDDYQPTGFRKCYTYVPTLVQVLLTFPVRPCRPFTLPAIFLLEHHLAKHYQNRCHLKQEDYLSHFKSFILRHGTFLGEDETLSRKHKREHLCFISIPDGAAECLDLAGGASDLATNLPVESWRNANTAVLSAEGR